MWNTYSAAYIRHNRAASRFIMAISLLASMLLSLVGGVFYNFWQDQVHQALAAGTAQVETTPAILAYLVVFFCASLGLTMMIRHAFAATMTGRVRQLGILQSVGASPRQIRQALVLEILAVSAPAILLGNVLGICLSWLFIRLILMLTRDLRDYALTFAYSPAVFLGSVGFSLLTAYRSARIPAKKLSRISPIASIRGGDPSDTGRIKRYRLFSRVFGVYGTLARRSLYARRKAMRVGTVSVLLAVFSLVSLLNMLGISNLSTQKTYFDRFRDSWDFLITGEHCEELLPAVRQLDTVDSCSAHRAASGTAVIPTDRFSEEVMALGPEALSDTASADPSGGYSMEAWVYILDDASFDAYCGTQGAPIAAVNRIWDRLHSPRTDRQYLPLLKNEAAEIRVNGQLLCLSAFPPALPALREELHQGTLSLIMSESAFQSSGLELDAGEEILTIRVKPGADHTAVEAELQELLLDRPDCQSEGRLTAEEHENRMQRGLRLVVILFAALMACIGLANIFASTLGQLQQRKREFARYFSLGLTPSGAAMVLAWEAAVVALRPILLTVLVNIPLMAVMLNAGGISSAEFVAKRLPLVPALAFFGAILLLVALAYYLGGRKICGMDLAETIRDNTLDI